MQLADVRELNKEVQEYDSNVGGGESISTLYRLRQEEEIFFSAKYTRVKKRNSYTVLYYKEGVLRFGSVIQYFYIKWHPTALVQKLTVTARFREDIPIFSVRKSEEYDVCDIKEKCMYVEVDSSNVYVYRFPCKILTD